MVEPADHLQVLLAGQILVDRRILAGEPDHRPDLVRVGHHVLAEDPRGPGVRRQQGGQDADDGGLARAVGSQQTQHTALRDVQIHPGQGRRLLELLDQRANLDRGHHSLRYGGPDGCHALPGCSNRHVVPVIVENGLQQYRVQHATAHRMQTHRCVRPQNLIAAGVHPAVSFVLRVKSAIGAGRDAPSGVDMPSYVALTYTADVDWSHPDQAAEMSEYGEFSKAAARGDPGRRRALSDGHRDHRPNPGQGRRRRRQRRPLRRDEGGAHRLLPAGLRRSRRGDRLGRRRLPAAWNGAVEVRPLDRSWAERWNRPPAPC